MKKIIIGVFVNIFIVGTVFAVSVCAKNDVILLALDPSIEGSSNTYDESAYTWTVSFSYGDISGTAACLATSGTAGGYNTSITAVGGEQKGRYCWCKMLHPMESAWAFRRDYNSNSTCTSYCTRRCGNYVQTETALRTALFSSVGK